MKTPYYRQNTEHFHFSNLNPGGVLRSSDCVPRALAGVTHLSWKQVIRELTEYGIERNGVLFDDRIWATWLVEEMGWTKHKQPRHPNNKKFTVMQFIQAHPEGTFLINIPHHIAYIQDGVLYDTINCKRSIVGNYYTPPKQ